MNPAATYLWICVVLFFAGVTQGLSGFGSILLSLPLLALFLDIKVVVPLLALAGLAMSILLLVQLRAHVDWKKILPLLAGTLPGVPVGVFFLKKLDRSMIQWILGVILVGYALYSLLWRRPGRGIARRWAYLFGFLAGCLGGALSAASPPVIVYISLQPWSKDQLKVTLQGFFVTSGLAVVTVHALSGVTTPEVLQYFTVATPVLLLGTYVGSRFYGMIKEEHYRRLMLGLLGLLGCFMILRA